MTMYSNELSQKTGLSVHTLRFYEKIGLIRKSFIRRLPNNYRDYDPRLLDVLRFAKFAQSIGFSLSEIATLCEDDDLVNLSRAKKIALLEIKQGELNKKLKELQIIRTTIKRKLDLLRSRS